MKDYPILFSAPMVRALLDGSKTQTRRAMNPQPVMESVFLGGHQQTVPVWKDTAGPEGWLMHKMCPYGQPGDRLWVRESFWGCDLPGYGDQPCVVYDDEWVGKEYQPALPRPWARKFGRIPSIHMPRDCSRILLEIVAVRVERLNDISEEDARAEGCTYYEPANHLSHGGWSHDGHYVHKTALASFERLWESINGAGSWSANPWVWVVEFKRLLP